jgi:CheY-like chemotaxis protein
MRAQVNAAVAGVFMVSERLRNCLPLTSNRFATRARPTHYLPKTDDLEWLQLTAPIPTSSLQINRCLGMDGVEFCRLLRRTPTLAAVPVILTSADPVIASEARLWTDFWQKPVLAETMLASIAHILADRIHEHIPNAQ